MSRRRIMVIPMMVAAVAGGVPAAAEPAAPAGRRHRLEPARSRCPLVIGCCSPSSRAEPPATATPGTAAPRRRCGSPGPAGSPLRTHVEGAPREPLVQRHQRPPRPGPPQQVVDVPALGRDLVRRQRSDRPGEINHRTISGMYRRRSALVSTTHTGTRPSRLDSRSMSSRAIPSTSPNCSQRGRVPGRPRQTPESPQPLAPEFRCRPVEGPHRQARQGHRCPRADGQGQGLRQHRGRQRLRPQRARIPDR